MHKYLSNISFPQGCFMNKMIHTMYGLEKFISKGDKA
jgi:hypothetical protein